MEIGQVFEKHKQWMLIWDLSVWIRYYHIDRFYDLEGAVVTNREDEGNIYDEYFLSITPCTISRIP